MSHHLGRWRLTEELGGSRGGSALVTIEREGTGHPVSGMHRWHQRVRLEKAGPDDRYGDIMVDTERSHEVYREWMERTRPAPGPDGLRRPLWFDRPLRPAPDSYKLDEP